ncbi:glycoside hydrolase family 9 protein [Pseudobacteroides cellulosolvens]|uniref:Cellulose 1,4-beta-cellobiosidase n=1 Tax=Pseudobacteroides cellulosolvens ATCC 35603 = DSM 2933 TaxID=398512 RepID=A0A0L6JSE9_9FIRM|nr:glycoside hydrolase family 9 protein [Pseudobacteroides cellulosolvens]KNY28342.1 Cellulose 1,4-beta-cellobiosidase [Pseudobacteroides cellulosolvens ATCC 35603 = DSM 2933]
MVKKLTLIGALLTASLAGGLTCSAAEILQTTNFESGVNLPWHISESNEQNSWSGIKDGKYVVHMESKGTNKWDVQIRHQEISIVEDHTYTVKFSLSATKDCMIYAKIGDKGEPYGEVWNNKWMPFKVKANEILSVTDTFVADKDYDDAEFSFHLGGELAGALPYDISFISMSLDDPQFEPTPTPAPTPARNIRVNQLGYYPNAAKKATLKVKSTQTSSVDWQLKNSSGTVVASGTTKPFGFDEASDEIVHIIDFSDYNTPGKDYQLYAGSETSFPFDIGIDMYSQMKYDALKYFYHARSGTEIKMPYCVDSKWARPAGHTDDVAVLVTGRGYNGPETINGTGGWYDGGDHGKYVVNGGFALWMLQNQYEHSKKSGVESIFEDNKLNIPESGNNINDLLDETRWEMEWMLKMQIPAGFDRSGMAAHKLADEKWTLMPKRPDQDTENRIYYPPSTAATLNLAACAAQASRIWKNIDPEFSTRCLIASQTAYQAAKASPSIFASYGQESGSFTYGDNYVEDEFYWAACELYVTTGEEEFLADLKGYKDSLKIPEVLSGEYKGFAGCFDSRSAGGLGTLTLALHKKDEFPNVIDNFKNAADTFIAVQNKEGYGIPLSSKRTIEFMGEQETIEAYPYASNTYVINEALVMAYAYDLTKDTKYINGLTESMDYLMGRNPLIKAYVSGYGENPVKYPHHRFFCPQVDKKYPSVPPGFFVGGPYSGSESIWLLDGRGPLIGKVLPVQTCYTDDIDAWDTNEVKINFNAPFAWVTYYLDAFGKEIPVRPACTPTNTGIMVPEDFNQDGVVNMADVVLLAKEFGNIIIRYNPKYDLNNDGAINMADVIKVAIKFGYIYKLE